MTYETLHVDERGAVVTVTIDNPPINLMDVRMMRELGRLGAALAPRTDLRVIVVESADPEFFIAHGDVRSIRELPVGPQPRPHTLNALHQIMERWRTLPQATIAKVAGRARGGGSEFALSLDLRYAARGRALLGQPEVALGILAGGSGTQRTSRLLGRSRALEVLLTCMDVDADLAERYGYVTRAVDADELDGLVAGVAQRIASMPAEAIALTKVAVDAAWPSPFDGLMAEAQLWDRAFSTAEAQRRLTRFLDVGGQTREGEDSWDGLVEALAEVGGPSAFEGAHVNDRTMA